MSGFQVYNSDSKILVDSDFRSTLYYDNRALGAISDTGFYEVNSPFGNGSTLGFLPTDYWADGYLRWIQLTSGKYGMPGANLMEANAGRMVRTSRTTAMQSGYLNVYNSAGSLIWSANSASKMPRIKAFVDIPSAYDLQDKVFSISLTFNPWILSNACPGNLTDDGAVTGYSGLMLKWTGSQLQASYVSKNQRNWSQTFQSRGIRVPLAQFVGI